MLSVLRHLNYKPWFAIAEFIDNAVQSYVTNRDALIALNGADYTLKVDVRVDIAGPGLITVTDNAAGISAADFPRAFRAAQIPTDRSGLSEFGMGMKSAACWFAQRWTVRTKALGETVERTISFDIRHIVDNRIESLATAVRDEPSPTSFTVVTLRGLHHLPQGRTIGKIKEHLASIYRMFLRDGNLELTFNGEPLSYTTAPILKAIPYSAPGAPVANAGAVEWFKPICLDFGKGQRVTGFAALREVGSTPFAGFALFRRNRLIEGSHDDTYRPSFIFKQTNSYQYQRLFGELHVEGFEVSHTKDGFRWEEYEDIFLEHLKEALEDNPLDLIAQAENYRALPSRKTIEARATAATDAVAKHLQKDITPLLEDAREHPAEPEQLPSELPISDLNASESTVTLNDGSYKWVVTLRTSIDPAREDWVSVAKQDTRAGDEDRIRRLGIDLSLAHPFSSEFLGSNNENVELFLRFAAALGISLVLSEDTSGDPPENVLYHYNHLLRGAISSAFLQQNGDKNSNTQYRDASSTLGA
jgi:hypothetical protein